MSTAGYPVKFPSWIDEFYPTPRCRSCSFVRTQVFPVVHVKVSPCIACTHEIAVASLERVCPVNSWEHMGIAPKGVQEKIPILRILTKFGASLVYCPTWVKDVALQFTERKLPGELLEAAYMITTWGTDHRDFLISLVTMGAPSEQIEEFIFGEVQKGDALRFLDDGLRTWFAQEIATRRILKGEL